MDGFGVFLKKEIREAARTSRLLVVTVIFVFFGLLSPVTAKYMGDLLQSLGSGVQIVLPPPTVADAMDQFLKNVGQNGIFIAILVTMGIVAREKERGTAAFVLNKPLSRPAFLLAKLAGVGVTLGIGILAAACADYLYTALLFQPLALAGFAFSAALVFLMLMAYAAITFLGSTLTNSPLPAAGIGIAGFVALAILGALPTIGNYTPTALLGPARAIALGQQPRHLTEALVGTLALIFAPSVVAWLSFSRQELATA